MVAVFSLPHKSQVVLVVFIFCLPPPANGKKPQYVGHWTNDIIYSRLAPGVLRKLKNDTPKFKSGSRKRKFFQQLTKDYGHPELEKLLSNVMFLMRGCTKWDDFKRKLERAKQKHGDTIPIDYKDLD